MSNSPENIRLTVIRQEVQGNDKEVERRATLQAHILHNQWRSRLNPPSDDDPLSKDYPFPSGEHVTIHSSSASKVRLEHAAKDGNQVAYEFDHTEGSLVIEANPEALPSGATNLMMYDRFSRLLFDCDKAEFRGTTAE